MTELELAAELMSYDPSRDAAVVGIGSSYAEARSGRWPMVRAKHLLAHPQCAACGSRTALNVHHVVPFHDAPVLELDPENLITLCECPSHNCHLVFGHFLNWKLANPAVREDVSRYYHGFTKARE